jgi:uncharacterized protein (TIGR04255 family)
MVFPDSTRVIYEKNTLSAVICQLRFPPILRIESEIPATFQDRVRAEYPLFREKRGPEFPPGLPVEAAKALSAAFPAPRAYDFLSADEAWTASLTKEFLALSTNSYERWEGFKGRLESLRQTLLDAYRPAFFSRIGLRYINVIRRTTLGLKTDTDWRDLLEEWVLGELARPEVMDRVEHAAREVVVELEDRSKVRIMHGLAKDEKDGESLYTIDADYFTEQRTEVADAIATLDRFNRESGRLFRWYITEQLHRAMDPREMAEAPR